MRKWAFPLRIKWESGVLIEYKDAKVIFDLQSKSINHGVTSFVTHAHIDHSRAFKLRHISKFSSEETKSLVTLEGIKADKWWPLTLNKGIKLGDIEVIPHFAGHILGSCEFEVSTPDGTVLFTGDINTRETRTVKPAEPIKCDVLIIEATFGSPEFVFPPDEILAEEMVSWANKALDEGKTPIFQADAIGNAQEVIRIFNENASIPVISHSKISKVNEVYEHYGCKVNYIDINSEEASELILNRNAVIVAPKRLDLFPSFEYTSAMVTGWAIKFKRRSFPLSDHADFSNLIRFIGECNPKIVLTYHGGRFNEVLAKYIEKNLGVRSYPLDLIPTNFSN